MFEHPREGVVPFKGVNDDRGLALESPQHPNIVGLVANGGDHETSPLLRPGTNGHIRFYRSGRPQSALVGPGRQ